MVGLGALAPTGMLSALENTLVSGKNIKLGIIGTGSRGAGLIPYINATPKLSIASLCDILPFRLDDAKKQVDKNVKAVNDYRRVLEDTSIDAVLIATPYYLHGKMALEALNAGKHIYCEKTLAKDMGEIDALVNAVSKSNLIFQTGHQYHSSRLYNHIVRLIKQGEIGTVKSFECQWYRKGDWRRPVPDPQYERAINWRMYREYSGGMTAELSSHQIDFVNWVLGENPSKIMGTGGIDFWKDGRETYDNTHLIFEYPSGVKASFKCLTSNIPGGYQIQVIGDKGSITINTAKAWVKHYKEKPKAKAYENVDGVSGATASYGYSPQFGTEIDLQHLDPSKQALADFRDAIHKQEQPISDVLTGANTAKAVNLAIKAMLIGQTQYW